MSIAQSESSTHCDVGSEITGLLRSERYAVLVQFRESTREEKSTGSEIGRAGPVRSDGSSTNSGVEARGSTVVLMVKSSSRSLALKEGEEGIIQSII